MKNKITAILTLACLSLSGWAQTGNYITGRVVDNLGDPVPGALITIEDSPSVKTATDQDGNFEIVTLKNDILKVLTFSDDVKRVPVTSENEPLTIVIDYSSLKVNHGFGLEQTRTEFTGAASTVYAEDIDTRSAFNIGNSLYGNVLGLTTLQKTGTVWD